MGAHLVRNKKRQPKSRALHSGNNMHLTYGRQPTLHRCQAVCVFAGMCVRVFEMPCMVDVLSGRLIVYVECTGRRLRRRAAICGARDPFGLASLFETSNWLAGSGARGLHFSFKHRCVHRLARYRTAFLHFSSTRTCG